VFLAAAPAWSQPCKIPGAVKDALAAAGSGGASAKEAAQNVRDRFPRDYFAHRAYQGASFSGGVFSSAVQTEYRALRDRHPEDPLYISLNYALRPGPRRFQYQGSHRLARIGADIRPAIPMPT